MKRAMASERERERISEKECQRTKDHVYRNTKKATYPNRSDSTLKLTICCLFHSTEFILMNNNVFKRLLTRSFWICFLSLFRQTFEQIPCARNKEILLDSTDFQINAAVLVQRVVFYCYVIHSDGLTDFSRAIAISNQSVSSLKFCK